MHLLLRRNMIHIIIFSVLLLLLSGLSMAGITTRVSVASSGAQSDDISAWDRMVLSTDGRYAAFTSYAGNLVVGDTNNTCDIFVHDSLTGQTTRVSVSSSGAQGNFWSAYPSISADGRYVAFTSQSNNLVSGDTNGFTDVFIYDRQTGQTTRVSVASNGTQGNQNSVAWVDSVALSEDGRYIAFTSDASNLVTGDTNGKSDVFVHDRQTGQTTRVSVASDGVQGNAASGWYGIDITMDGRYVTFTSDADNLVSGDTNGKSDVFVHDCQTDQTTRVSVAYDGSQGSNVSAYPSISANGRYVAFNSESSNLVPGDTNGVGDVFIYDRQTSQTARVSVASDGTQANNGSAWVDSLDLSTNGRCVVFKSYASNLVSDDTNNKPDVFVHDCQTGQTTRVSVASDGTQANDWSEYPSITPDGRFVAFNSNANNLVPGDTNYSSDNFIHDRWAIGTLPPVGSAPGMTPPAGAVLDASSPYSGYTPVRWAKGQINSHYYNDTLNMAGSRSWTPLMLMSVYGTLGYDFVCVTEHFHATTDPLLPSPLFIRYCEEVSNDSKHVLAIGIEHTGCTGISSGQGGNEQLYFPWDMSSLENGLCEVEQFGCSTVKDKVAKIHEWGGLAVIAHPSGVDNKVSETEILASNPDAVSIYTSSMFSSAVEKWDNLLSRGAVTSSSGQITPIFGMTEDDFTPVAAYQGLGRTWIVAELDSENVTQESVMQAVKKGRFWSYRSCQPYPEKGPILKLTTYKNDQGKLIIRVTSNETIDQFTFVRNKSDIGVQAKNAGSGSMAEYGCEGDELYVRVEAKKGAITAYSQPVGIKWSYSSTASGIVYTCAQPEQLPAKMPPLGYIGRAYFTSTTSGTYSAGSMLTLSYQGIDVTQYSTSNVAIYRWDSSAVNWVKLAGTIDTIKATVTAPLTQSGLYCISAEIVGDTTAPTVTIHTPASNSTLTALTTVGVQASDNMGVLRTSFYLNEQCIGVDSSSYDGFTCDYNFSKKPSGQYTLKVKAEDVSGSVGESQVTVNITSEGAAPAISITSPIAGTILEDVVTISGTCTDNSLVAGVFICLDGVYVGEASVTGNNWTYQFSAGMFANGNHALSAIVMDEDQNTSEQSVGIIIAGQSGTGVSEAKMFADGQQVKLTGQVVTFGSPGYNGDFYIEEDDRSSGMRIEGMAIPAEGDTVSVSGIMITSAGERVMVGADVLVLSSSNTLPLPLGLTNTLLGGGQFGSYAPGITGGYGLQNLGLLVRTWGKITQIGSGCMYVDDGCNLKDGTSTGADENIGVRIICDPAGYNTGDYANITGISSSFETPSGKIARQVITRRPDDVKH